MKSRISAAVSGLLVLSCLGSVNAKAENLEHAEWENNLQTLELQVKLGCDSDRPGEIRAAIADGANKRAEKLGNDLKTHLHAIQNFLQDPMAIARWQTEQELRGELATRRARLAAESQRLEGYQRYGLVHPDPASVIEEQRDRIREQRRRVGEIENKLAAGPGRVPAAEHHRQASQAKAEFAMKDLRKVADYGRRVDIAANRANGCYNVATHQAKRAVSGIQYAENNPDRNGGAYNDTQGSGTGGGADIGGGGAGGAGGAQPQQQAPRVLNRSPAVVTASSPLF